MRVIYKALLGITAATMGAAVLIGDPALAPADPRPAAAAQGITSSSVTTPPTTTKRPSPTPTTTPPPPPPPPPTTTPPPPPPPPTTTARPKPKPSVGTPCRASARACIDLSANVSWLLDGGRVIYGPVPITHGRPGYRTPAGTFRVQWKDIDHTSSLFDDAPMPYSVFFNGGIAFHAGSLRVLSHGCIHLSDTAARRYYNTLHVGDIVQVVP